MSEMDELQVGAGTETSSTMPKSNGQPIVFHHPNWTCAGLEKPKLTISEMQKEAYRNSDAHGFHTDVRDNNPLGTALRLMLIVSEAVEALEEDRAGRPNAYFEEGGTKRKGLATELADIVIRCGDLAETLTIDLEHEVLLKMQFNAGRPFKHGGKRY